jgi:uncharacterized protein (DUF1684 family)
MSILRAFVVIGLSTLAGMSVWQRSYAVDAAEEEQAVQQWRAKRVATLRSESGWLTLVGLYWLKEGKNTFGRAKANTLMLDHPALPASAGSFLLSNGHVKFAAHAGSGVTHAGKPVATIDLVSDAQAAPTVLSVGSLQFFVIERVNRLGVRVRDTQHPARMQFKGLDYFPVSASWATEARFEPYVPARHIPIVNILGMTEQMAAPGALVFSKNGREWRLDAVLEEPGATELFILFADATSGRETYGAGRFIYVPLPVNGKVPLDFNKAYNPPCAFNDFATCPLPPQQNRLQLRVEAGEKKYMGGH